MGAPITTCPLVSFLALPDSWHSPPNSCCCACSPPALPPILLQPPPSAGLIVELLFPTPTAVTLTVDGRAGQEGSQQGSKTVYWTERQELVHPYPLYIFRDHPYPSETNITRTVLHFAGVSVCQKRTTQASEAKPLPAFAKENQRQGKTECSVDLPDLTMFGTRSISC